MSNFFFSKSFFINGVLALLFTGLVIFGVFRFINHYTHHGETISVPNLEGLTLDEVDEILKIKQLRFSVLDSIYIADARGGTVLEQTPSTDNLVKQNRTIYVTIAKIEPPKVAMPDVVDMSLRLAMGKLKSYGLKVNTQQRPSACVNCVLSQEIDGKIVQPNQPIEKGSTVTLTVGIGTSDQQIMTPYLIGLTKDEAQEKLMNALLTSGFMDYTDCNCNTKADSLLAKVYRQEPISNEETAIHLGSAVDLYFTCDTNKIKMNLRDSLTKDSLNLVD